MTSTLFVPKNLPALKNKSTEACSVDCVDDNPPDSPHIVQIHRAKKTRERLLKVVF